MRGPSSGSSSALCPAPPMKKCLVSKWSGACPTWRMLEAQPNADASRLGMLPNNQNWAVINNLTDSVRGVEVCRILVIVNSKVSLHKPATP
jgi:hypothetical protein